MSAVHKDEYIFNPPKKFTKSDMLNYCHYLTEQFKIQVDKNEQLAMDNAYLLEKMQEQINYFRGEFQQEARDIFKMNHSKLDLLTIEATKLLDEHNAAAERALEVGANMDHETRFDIGQEALDENK